MATSCVCARGRLNSHCQNELPIAQAVFRIKTESTSRLTSGTLTECFANASHYFSTTCLFVLKTPISSYNSSVILDKKLKVYIIRTEVLSINTTDTPVACLRRTAGTGELTFLVESRALVSAFSRRIP